MSIQIETAATETCSMDFFRFGKGERTLVILPGLSVQSVMGAAEAVAAAYRSMADDFTVFVFDRRRELPPVYTIRDMARDTADALDALGLGKVCVFGASQGGMIALTLAAGYPAHAERLALGSSAARVRPERFRTVENWIGLAKRGDREGLYLAFGRDVYPPAVFAGCRDMLLETAAGTTDADLARFVILAEAIRDFDGTAELSRIRCPVLALGARDDAVLGPDAAAEIAKTLGDREDFQLYMYDGYGHAAFDTAPDYRERLLRFFTE